MTRNHPHNPEENHKRDGFQTLSRVGYPQRRSEPSRNSIEVVSRFAKSQSDVTSTEPL
jgi:hypothetical protein